MTNIAPDTVLLAIDAGNTRIKWGVHDGQGWRSRGALDTAHVASLDESIRGALPANAAVASNVAGDAARNAIAAACERAGLELRIVKSEARTLGVTNGYRDPGQLGSDRWAALVAAHHLHRGDKLVVNAGTAVTIDALDADGLFRGGFIIPGAGLMRRCLDRGTAALRESPGEVSEFPASTADAIASGAIAACAGAVERLGRTMAAHGRAPGLIILSGGAALQLAPALGSAWELHESLVLDGLQLIARNA